MSCLGGWVFLNSLVLVSLSSVKPPYDTLVWGLLIGSAIVVHVLLWWKGFAGPWAAGPDEWLLEVAVSVWLGILGLFQLFSLLLLLGALGLISGWDDGSSWFTT